MRDAIRNAFPANPPSDKPAEKAQFDDELRHFGLAYDLLGPPPEHAGEVHERQRARWLEACEAISIDPDYAHYYKRWQRSFQQDEATFVEVEAKTRLLVGHGNSSASEVGLTVHRTWGVPVIPGSSLKGLVAHYVDAVYGADGTNDLERRGWRAPTIARGPIAAGVGPGEHFAIMFGSPAVEAEGSPGRRGLIEFQDALFVPESVNNRPFARDVLTVHQSDYYRSSGRDAPNDWTSPIPVPFITVKPGARFLLVLTGPNAAWRDLARRFLLEALDQWGVGGKTSAGYGRLKPK